MNENYEIDISKNTPNQSKEARIGKYIYMYGFFFWNLLYYLHSKYKQGLVKLCTGVSCPYFLSKDLSANKWTMDL